MGAGRISIALKSEKGRSGKASFMAQRIAGGELAQPCWYCPVLLICTSMPAPQPAAPLLLGAEHK